MKFVAYIFALYMLGLNFLPCNDLFAYGTHTDQVELTQLSLEAEHSHQDNCSPFCQCHCCHVHVIELDALAVEPVVTTIDQHLFFHLNPVGWEIPHSFLQPPRV